MLNLVNIFLLAVSLTLCVPATAADAYSGTQAEVYSTAAPMQAQTYGGAVTNKLGSGFFNLLLGWVEIPKNMMTTSNDVNVALGLIGGPVKGVLHSMGRVMTGVFDILTFPVPTEPLTTPQYVWQNWPVETRYNPIKMAPIR